MSNLVNELNQTRNLSNDVQTELGNIPHLSERMVIDMVNGLVTSKNHLDYMENQSFLSKVSDDILGKRRLRELSISQMHQQSLSNILTCIQELFSYGTFTNKALSTITNQLTETRENLLEVARLSTQNYDEIRQIKKKIQKLEESIHYDFLQMSKRIDNLERLRMVEKRIELLDDSWKLRDIYRGYPPYVAVIFFLQDIMRYIDSKTLSNNYNLIMKIRNTIRIRLQETYDINTYSYQPLDSILMNKKDTLPELCNEIILYLLETDKKNSVIVSVRETVLLGATPDWLYNEQIQKGLIPVFIDGNDLIEMIMEESGIINE